MLFRRVACDLQLSMRVALGETVGGMARSMCQRWLALMFQPLVCPPLSASRPRPVGGSRGNEVFVNRSPRPVDGMGTALIYSSTVSTDYDELLEIDASSTRSVDVYSEAGATALPVGSPVPGPFQPRIPRCSAERRESKGLFGTHVNG